MTVFAELMGLLGFSGHRLFDLIPRGVVPGRQGSIGTRSLLLVLFDMLHTPQTTNVVRRQVVQMWGSLMALAKRAVCDSGGSWAQTLLGHQFHLKILSNGVLQGLGALLQVFPTVQKLWEENLHKPLWQDASHRIMLHSSPVPHGKAEDLVLVLALVALRAKDWFQIVGLPLPAGLGGTGGFVGGSCIVANKGSHTGASSTTSFDDRQASQEKSCRGASGVATCLPCSPAGWLGQGGSSPISRAMCWTYLEATREAFSGTNHWSFSFDPMNP